MKKLMFMGAFVFSMGAFAQDQSNQVVSFADPVMCFSVEVYACDSFGMPITDPNATGYKQATAWLRHIPNESTFARKARMQNAQDKYCEFGLVRHECL